MPQIRHHPREIPGYPEAGTGGVPRLMLREALWATVAGTAAGLILVGFGQEARLLLTALLVFLALAAGGWAAESLFFHFVGPRAPDPFSPGAYLARATLWSLLGGVAVGAAGELATLFLGAGLPRPAWLVIGAVASILVQAPLRLRYRRAAERRLVRVRR